MKADPRLENRVGVFSVFTTCSDRVTWLQPVGAHQETQTFDTTTASGRYPVNFIDPLGLFQFGSRPLEGAPWIPGGSSNPIDDYFNTEISHEHGFFEDGSGDNIGFGPNGRFSENPDGRGYRMDGTHYNDALMREALKNVQDGNYSLLGWGPMHKNNCQDWADRLRAEYERLQKEQKGNGCK